jgi:hypothetical protein
LKNENLASGGACRRSRSPPVSRVWKPAPNGWPAASTASVIGVGRIDRVTSWAAIHADRRSGSTLISWLVTTMQAPAVKCGQTSQTEASNPTPAARVTRSVSVMP